MKKLFLLVSLAALMYGTIFILQSVYFSLFELHQAVVQGNLDEVKKRADLDSFTRGLLDIRQAQLKVIAKDKAGELGEGLFAGLASIVRNPLEKELLPEMKAQIESEIAGGRLLENLGPFELGAGLLVFGGTEQDGHKQIVHIHGACAGEPATISVVFVPARNERWGGFLKTYRASGLLKSSIGPFVEACYAGEKKSSPKG